VDSQRGGYVSLANVATMTMNSDEKSFIRPFPTPQEVGKRIRAARKKRGWTIAEMAAVGGLNAVVIGSYERGSRVMPFSRLGEIAEILNVDITYLLDQPLVPDLSTNSLILDLRMISRPANTEPERLAILVNFCAGVVRKRNDWNGEILTIRKSDLTSLSFALGISQPELLSWLTTQDYLIKAINHS